MADILPAAPKKLLEADHAIVSITQLPTGRIFLCTERRLYELVNNVWEPMTFKEAVLPPDPVVLKEGDVGPDGVIVPQPATAAPAPPVPPPNSPSTSLLPPVTDETHA
jgi:hypothetical protein